MHRISFLVPTFNRAGLIAETLTSILGEMSVEDELLVVDDGSTDGTGDVVARFGDRVRYVRQENGGKSTALNRGLAMTDGAYVWICDDDDLFESGAVALLHDEIVARGADVVFGRYTRFVVDDAGAAVDIGTGYWPDLAHGSILRHILENNFVHQHGAIVRRACYAATGPFNEALFRAQDTEMFVRLALLFPFHHIDAVTFRQRRHDGVRGPRADLHAPGQSDAVWLRNEQTLYRALAPRMPIDLFERMFAADRPEIARRAALLQRACVFARRDLWEEAFADLDAAARLTQQPLDPGEADICMRMLNGKLGFAGARAPEVSARLSAFARRDPVCGRIVALMVQGIRWHLLSGTVRERLALAAFMVKVAGVGGAARALLASAPDPGAASLVENSQVHGN